MEGETIVGGMGIANCELWSCERGMCRVQRIENVQETVGFRFVGSTRQGKNGV